MPHHHLKLRDLLTRIAEEQHYDFAVLDCPPNLGILTWSALNAADEVLIPVEPSFFSLHGLAKISETLQVVNQSREVPLAIHALLTLFNSQVNLSHEIYDEVKARHAMLDSIDLLMSLRNLLRDDFDARAFYQGLFDHLLRTLKGRHRIASCCRCGSGTASTEPSHRCRRRPRRWR